MTTVPDLPWPHDLFSHAFMAQPLQQQQREMRTNTGAYCACGCSQEHQHRVTQTVHSAQGSGCDVPYFPSNACKSRFNKARVGR
jgi:hypothetical protein